MPNFSLAHLTAIALPPPELIRVGLRTGYRAVGVQDIEFVKITPDIDIAALEPFVAAGAELGAKYVVNAPHDPDLTRLADRLGAMSDLCVRYGMRAILEFFPWTEVPNLGAALAVVKATGRAECGVLVDTLHFARRSFAR